MPQIDIDELTEAELINLNHRIVERLKFLQQMRAHGAMMKFNIGQRVMFDPPGRPRVTGLLVKYNKKTVTVVTDEGERWNVPPDLLRLAQAKDITPASGNIVPIK
ncbi:hypothetical protein TVNIR_2040 [Thioalkalivibrio nitratireducens DSM 14787]|uniref:Uncharacterized protein n=1 Tax=Thioalkalivibrio nitratireducens (strain DSM 14787 / UNIQEM 213 / ALEN2) TaxID=1255043 RepID=L0DXK7_THIND|nr:hypothetical protein [Thioalkalivibrio nitratireducens]AGA33700.1 hypothetical protein TVNIR_2040 [Thioalkalivibrio nitratireducens DSM 14787]